MPEPSADRSLPPALDGVLARRVPRRTLLAGVAGAGVLGVGAVAAGAGLRGSDRTKAPAAPAATEPAGALAAGPGAVAPTEPRAAAPDPPSAKTARRPAAQGVPDGMALVSSPRLPLFGVGAADVDALLSGGVADWRAVGGPLSLPVEPLALDGAGAGVAAVETFADYEALAAALDERPGGVALVPLEQVDFRVNVLAVDGFDPLRDGGDGIVRIAVVGDIVPGRNVHLKMQNYGDWTRPFHKVAEHLSAYDLTIANLEGNLSDSLPQPVETNPNTYTFLSDPAMLEGFRLAGIDAVSLANNHTVWNSEGWGVQGLLDTIAALEAYEFPFFGGGREIEEARQPWVVEVKGKRIALLGVDGVTANRDIPAGIEFGVVDTDVGAGADGPGTNPYSFNQVTADVAAAAEQYDVVIPYLHMGAEYKWLVPNWVVEAAHGCVDAGATVVVTNHPHLIQGMETYQTTPIVYSPGNFVFDQMFSVETRQGLILEIVLDVRGEEVRVVGIRNRGVEIEDFHQPRLMTAEEQASIMDRFWRATDWLAGR